MNRAFTLLEMLCVMAIVASLASILFPVVVQAKRGSAAVSCAANLRSISEATTLYTSDYDDLYPHAISRYDRAHLENVPVELWPQAKGASDIESLISNYLVSSAVLYCPADYGLEGVVGHSAFSLFGSSYNTAVMLEGQSTTCWRSPSNEGYAHDLSPYWHAHDRTVFDSHRRNLLYYDSHASLVPMVKSALTSQCGR